MQKNFVCESPSNLCFINQCEVCKSIQLFSKLTEQLESSEENVTWKEWQEPEKKSYVNIEKVTKKGTVSDLVNRISKMREKFVTHSEIKQNQSKAFKGNLEQTKIDSPVAVLQVDWAENFKCFTQNETQAAHFGQHQVSIFTAALWHQQQLKTFAIVSDSLDHTKTSVAANTIKILEILPAIVKLVHIQATMIPRNLRTKTQWHRLSRWRRNMTSKYSGTISQQCMEKELLMVSVQQSSEWQATKSERKMQRYLMRRLLQNFSIRVK